MSNLVNVKAGKLFGAIGVSLNSLFDHFDTCIVGDCLIDLLLKRKVSKK